MTNIDANIFVDDLMSDYNINHIIATPYETRRLAEERLATTTDADEKERLQKIIDRQNEYIDHNNKYVVPYIAWMVSNL